MRLAYDPDTDVVRVMLAERADEAVAVPLEDLTILVSPTLDRVIGVNIQDLPTFVSNYVADQLVPAGAEGQELFEAAQLHLERLMTLFIRNLGPVAKDQVARWDEQVEAILRQRGSN